ncbi:MAG: electron transfer flavoprotein subunit alpha/FixB family protein [Syntrophorhabdaceae bacterium]|nr:electron transfer flavoprotein subunit alpha/FixB family protein [Syntrophorhabdaceae bacterium]
MMENNHRNVLVFGEVLMGKIVPITLELLAIGRRLADDLGEELYLMLLGEGTGRLGEEAITFGADQVYFSEEKLLNQYNSDLYTHVADSFCRRVLPSVILFGHTDIGCDLAPRLNGRIGGGLSIDCMDLSIDKEKKHLIMRRPVFGGNAIATVISNRVPQMATIRPKTFQPLEKNLSRQGDVIPLEEKIDPSLIKARVVNYIKEEVEGVKLEEAEVVVSGGRGIEDKKNFTLLKELADLLGGAIGATRVACDEGWVPAHLQIGQSGKVVSPKIYIAIGLSGAMAHISGCLGSKYIVAINKDSEANIFNVAHLGFVGDWKEVLPPLIERLRELKGK